MRNDQVNSDNGAALDRRRVLLGGTTLAAASVIATGTSVEVAQGQTQAPARQTTASLGGRPNILVIMGDDVGWFNIGAYHRGIMGGRPQTWTS